MSPPRVAVHAATLTAIGVVVTTACAPGSPSLPEVPSDAGVDGAGDADPVEAGPAPAPPCEPRQPGRPSDAIVPAPFAGMTNPLPASARENGGSLFSVWCARCHGTDGRGGGSFEPPPADLTAARRPEDYLFWRIAKGGRGDPTCSRMPAFEGSLGDEDRWRIVAFVRSFGPDGG